MAVIKIKRGNPQTGELELSRRGRTKADTGERITWKVKKGSGVSAVQEIFKKPTPPSDNLFSEDPHQAGNPKTWKARVNTNATYGSKYLYSIKWTDDNGNTPPDYDPLISVNPRYAPLARIIAVLVAVSALFSVLFLGLKKKQK